MTAMSAAVLETDEQMAASQLDEPQRAPAPRGDQSANGSGA